MMSIIDEQSFGPALLRWYDTDSRDLPWRYKNGACADPYRVWLSEIMLQQTQVETVKPYFARFTSRWPTVETLAGAPLDDVLTEWAGLGYYARARNLHKCAKTVANEHHGHFPNAVEALLELPGIGPYTAAAIAAIVHDAPVAVVDGNVERVLSRLTRLQSPVAEAKAEVKAFAQSLTPTTRPGDYAQAMMDLGATVCTPKTPTCERCPVSSFCMAFAEGDMQSYPRKAPKKPKPTRRAVVFWLSSGEHVLLRRRPEKGLLGGMLEVPSSPWVTESRNDAENHAPAEAEWSALPGIVRHTFTHFHLEFEVRLAISEKFNSDKGEWVALADFERRAIPTLFRKVADHVVSSVRPAP